ncbi:MAG: thioredoxin-like domain-containing protein [Oceanihabitans sp.]
MQLKSTFILFTISIFLGVSCKKTDATPKDKTITTIVAPTKEVNTNTNGFAIAGVAFNIDNETVYLHQKTKDKFVLIDSSSVSNNTFNFNGFVTAPSIYSVSKNKAKAGFTFLVDNSKIDLFLNAKPSLSTTYSSSIIQKEYLAFNSKMKDFRDESIQLYYGLQGDFSETNIAQLQKDRTAIFTSENNYILHFITTHPDSYYAAMLLQDRLKTHDNASNRKLYNSLSIDVKDLPIAITIDSVLNNLEQQETKIKSIQTAATKKPKKRAYRPKAYSLYGKNPNGEHINLNTLKGKVVLVDFWASWCAPCRATNPTLVRLYNQYKNKGLVILSVSEDKGEPEWISAIQADNLSWNTHILDKNKSMAFRYGVASIPYKLLIDKQGNIASGKISGSQLENKIKALLNE